MSAPALVAVLAGGRSRRHGRRQGRSRSSAGAPLSRGRWPPRARRGSRRSWSPRRATPLPPLDVPVWIEPDEPSHPLAGLVCALERAAGGRWWRWPATCRSSAPELLARLAGRRAGAARGAARTIRSRAATSRPRCPSLRDALAREAPVREALAALAPAAGEASWARSATRRGSARRQHAGGAGAGGAAAAARVAPDAALRRAVDRGLRGRARPPGAERRGARGGAQARLRRRPRLRAPRRADRVLAGRRTPSSRSTRRSCSPRSSPAAPTIPTRERAGRRGRRRRDRRPRARGAARRGAARACGSTSARRSPPRRSGRNSGVLQHPLDEALTAVHERSLELYATLGHGFAYPAEPAGVLVLSDDPEALRARARRARRALPRGRAGVAGGRRAARRRAGPRRRPVRLPARDGPPGPARRGGRTPGRSGRARRAPSCASAPRSRPSRSAAAGVRPACAPSRPAPCVRGGRAVDGRARRPGPAPAPIAPLWGVNVEVRLPEPPRHVLEQAGIEALIGAGGGARARSSASSPPAACRPSARRSCRTSPTRRAARRGCSSAARASCPALARVATFGARACPRPQSRRRPPAARPARRRRGPARGHGPRRRGASRSARAPRSWSPAAILGGGTEIPPELAASRL